MLKIISFFFNDTSTTEIYTLSLHDALPIFAMQGEMAEAANKAFRQLLDSDLKFGVVKNEKGEQVELGNATFIRSEEHTSELQSQSNLVCRLLLEKKKHEHIKRADAAKHIAE